jgi:hypothetical protein
MKPKRLLAIPGVLALVAWALFVWQGGFGAGHGRFDQAMWIIGLPGAALTTFLSWWPGDFVGLVVFPLAINLPLWGLASYILNRRGSAPRD